MPTHPVLVEFDMARQGGKWRCKLIQCAPGVAIRFKGKAIPAAKLNAKGAS
jgi:hypothetical protein